MSIFQTFGKVLAPALGAGLLLSSAFWGRDRGADQTSQLANVVAPAADPGDIPLLPPLEDYGGAKDLLSSPLVGVSNRDNKRGTIPRIFGKNYRVFPVVAAHPYTIVTAGGSILRVVYEYGYGPLQIANRKISGRPIGEYPTVTVEERTGLSTDQPLTVYTNDVEQISFSEELKPGVGITKRTAQVCTSIFFTILFPEGIYREVDGVKLEAQFDFGIAAYNPTHGYAVLDYPSIRALSPGPKVVSFSYNVPEGIYDVLVGRSNPLVSNTIPDELHTCTWIDLAASTSKYPFTLLKDASGNGVYMARDGVVATTNESTPNLSGALGEYSAEVTSLLRSHDGTNWLAASSSAADNPAWIMVEILTGSANYRRASDSRIDIPAFKAFADWCVSKGFTFNWSFDQPEDMRSVLNKVASAGRGYFIENKNGKYSVGIDKEVENTSAYFTSRNIIQGSFNARVSYIEPVDYIAAQFINPDVDFQLDERKVFDDGKVEGVDFKREAIQFVGVTKSDHAYKLARYHMAQNKLRSWIYQFEVDLENLRCDVGDKVRLAHDLIGVGLGQGYITGITVNGSGDCTAVTIDARQSMFLDTRYTARIVLPDGSSVAKEVVAINGETKTLTFTTPIPHTDTLPEAGYLVMFGELDAESIEVLITHLEPTEDFGAVLTCVDYAPGVYTADTGSIPAWTSKISYSRKRETNIPAPTVVLVKSDESVLDRGGDGSLKTRIYVLMGAVPDFVDQFEWQIRRTGATNWSPSQYVGARSGPISIYDVEDGATYDVQIRSRKGNFFGLWTPINGHFVVGKTTPPPAVPQLVEREPDSTVIKWFYDAQHGVTVPPDLKGFRIKFNWGASADWENGYILADCNVTTRFDIGGLLFGVKTIMVKALDVAGNEQTEAPAMLQLDFGEAPTKNVVVEVNHAPAFTLGTKTNCSVESNKLVSDDDGGLFWPPDTALFWPADTELFWDSVNYVQGTYIWRYTPPLTERKPFKIMVPIVASGPYRLEYRIFGSTLFWPPDNALFWPPDDQLFWPGEAEPQWQPVPDAGIVGDWIEYEFRLTLLAGSERVEVSSLKHLIDVQDVVEYVNDFEVTDSDGLRAPIVNVYRGIATVTAALQQSPSHPDAARVEVVDKDKSGPLIQVLDSAGVGTTGIVDVIIKGY